LIAMLVCDGLASAADWDRLEDTMTLPRFGAILSELGRAPPVRRLAAAWLGFRPARGVAQPAGSFDDLMRTFAPDGTARTF
jgi:hypothetical protein